MMVEVNADNILKEIKDKMELMGVDRHEIYRTTPLNEIEDWDSLESVELCMHLEKEYKCSIPDDEMERWKIIEDVVKSVLKCQL